MTAKSMKQLHRNQRAIRHARVSMGKTKPKGCIFGLSFLSSINKSINQIPIAPISLTKQAQCHNSRIGAKKSKLMTQFRNTNGPSCMPVSVGERPSQRDVSSDVS